MQVDWEAWKCSHTESWTQATWVKTGNSNQNNMGTVTINTVPYMRTYQERMDQMIWDGFLNLTVWRADAKKLSVSDDCISEMNWTMTVYGQKQKPLYSKSSDDSVV